MIEQQALLKAHGLSKIFKTPGGSQVAAVDDVSLSIPAGQACALVGESGSGKTTLGRLILRLIEPSKGSVMLGNINLTDLSPKQMRHQRRHAQLVFQDPYSSLNPRMTVGQILTEPLVLHNLVPRNLRRQRMLELLDLIGLPSASAERYPNEFSGGQRQRVAIGRALAAEPKFIVCDEPVSALDVSVRSQILNLLSRLQKELGLTYLFISHDLGVVKHFSATMAVMYLGRIVEYGPTDRIFRSPRHPYTQALLSAIPLPVPGAGAGRQILTGELPSPLNPPSGCHFHTRCPFAVESCAQTRPLLEKTAETNGHSVACWRAGEIGATPFEHRRLQTSDSLQKLMSFFRR